MTERAVKKVKVTFQVREIRYSKDDFHVAITTKGQNVSGKFPAKEGYCYTAECEEVHHETYGVQYKVLSAQMVRMLSAAALGRFLVLRMKGKVGETVIGALVTACEQDDLDLEMLLDTHQRDVLVECVGSRNAKKVDLLLEHWPSIKPASDLLTPLLGYGLTEAMAEAAVALWGNRAITKVEEDPYGLILSIDGISYLTADKIAMRVGRIRMDDPIRLSAAFVTGMRDATTTGHIGVPRELLIDRTMLLVNECDVDKVKNKRVLKAGIPPAISAEMLGAHLQTMLVKEGATASEECEFSRQLEEAEDEKGKMIVWFKPLLDAERGIADRISKLSPSPRPDLAASVRAVAAEFGLPPSAEQIRSVENAFTSPISIVTGGPGTGKSFTLKLLITILKRAKIRFLQVAPTGRAAKRIAEATGEPAQTVHSSIGYQGSFKNCTFNAKNPMEVQCLIMDEASMADTECTAAILQALPDECFVILVGDVDQLSSVGPGQVLRDMIRSELIPVTRLTRGYRFAGGIAEAAESVNHGKVPETTEDGQFVFVDTERPAQEMLAAMQTLLKEGVNPDDIQVLSPVHKGAAGNTELNKAIQALVNPPESSDCVRLRRDTGDIRVGDRVMQNKNDKTLGLVNGDLGWIDSLPSGKGNIHMTIAGRDEPLELEVSTSLNLRLAYSITVHKSQGAEAPYVLMVLDRSSAFILRRSTVYTGITRGKQKVMVFAPRDALASAARKGEPVEGSRRTSLVQKLKAALSTRPAMAVADPLALAMKGDEMKFEDVPF